MAGMDVSVSGCNMKEDSDAFLYCMKIGHIYSSPNYPCCSRAHLPQSVDHLSHVSSANMLSKARMQTPPPPSPHLSPD